MGVSVTIGVGGFAGLIIICICIGACIYCCNKSQRYPNQYGGAPMMMPGAVGPAPGGMIYQQTSYGMNPGMTPNYAFNNSQQMQYAPTHQPII